MIHPNSPTPEKETVKIGVGHNDYCAMRTFRGLKIPGYTFSKQFPMLPRQITSRIPFTQKLAGSTAYYLPNRSVSAYHTFNEIVLNSKPWLLSFESVIPRVWGSEKLRKFLFSYLERDHCKALLGMSNNAVLHLKTRNQNFSGLDDVLKKTHVVYPYVPDHKESYQNHQNRSRSSEVIKVLFVGNEFFRKGGHIALSACERLSKNYPIEVTVVSNMTEYNYVTPTEDGSSDRWRKYFEDKNIRHFENIPFENVRALLSESDILMLTTMDDSFGFSVVEAMSTGVVPVVTGIEALPEIVEDNVNGIVVKVPTTEEERLDTKKISWEEMASLVEKRLEKYLNSPELHDRFSQAARKRYEEKFSESCLERNISNLYQKLVVKN